MHHVYRNELLNSNQYGFTPQKSAIEAAIVVTEYLEEALREGKIAIIVTLDVKEAFDSAWWPNIIVRLQKCKCPKNLYNLARNYLNERTAVISANIQIEKDVSKGCPQGSCCGPAFWNIVLRIIKLGIRETNKNLAFSDEVILAVKAETI